MNERPDEDRRQRPSDLRAFDPLPLAGFGGTAGPLESAESYVRGGVGPKPTHDEHTGLRNARAAAEEKRLRQWAFDHFDDPNSVKIPQNMPLKGGAEHEVYLDAKRRRVVKVTRKGGPASYGFGISLNNDGQGATAGEYLDRLRLHNEIFNDDVRLEGVLPTAGITKIVTSQPHLKGEAAAPSQIDAYMANKGFARLAPGVYHHADTGVLVHDLHPRNALITAAGKVRAIDPAIMRATPVMAESIRRMAEGSGENTPGQRGGSAVG